MAISLVTVDENFNVVRELARVDDLPTAVARVRQFARVGWSVDLIDRDTMRFVPISDLLAIKHELGVAA
jgi:hypothetical protein